MLYPAVIFLVVTLFAAMYLLPLALVVRTCRQKGLSAIAGVLLAIFASWLGYLIIYFVASGHENKKRLVPLHLDPWFTALSIISLLCGIGTGAFVYYLEKGSEAFALQQEKAETQAREKSEKRRIEEQIKNENEAIQQAENQSRELRRIAKETAELKARMERDQIAEFKGPALNALQPLELRNEPRTTNNKPQNIIEELEAPAITPDPVVKPTAKPTKPVKTMSPAQIAADQELRELRAHTVELKQKLYKTPETERESIRLELLEEAKKIISLRREFGLD